jgi:hypothetical protein
MQIIFQLVRTLDLYLWFEQLTFLLQQMQNTLQKDSEKNLAAFI